MIEYYKNWRIKMETETNVFLSEEDRDFLSEKVKEEVVERISLCKKESYTNFQKKILEMEMSHLTNFLECFFKAYEKNQNKVSPKMVFAKYGKQDVLDTLEKITDKDKLKKHFDKTINEHQAGVFFELIELANMLNVGQTKK
jgi:hypothetical protein